MTARNAVELSKETTVRVTIGILIALIALGVSGLWQLVQATWAARDAFLEMRTDIDTLIRHDEANWTVGMELDAWLEYVMGGMTGPPNVERIHERRTIRQ